MNLRSLRYFVTVVELSGISRAARALHIAQPALTQHVLSLEEKLQTQLLLRTVRGVVPTDAGLALYRNARLILRQVDQAMIEVQAQDSQPRGKVSIGMPTAVAYMLTVPLLGRIRQKYPEIELHIVDNMSGILLELLSGGRLDMSFLYVERQQASLKSIEVQKVLDEELVYVSTAQDTPPTIALADVSEEGWLLPAAPSGSRQVVDMAFSRMGKMPKVICELSSATGLKGALLAGYGPSILPPSIVMEEVKKGLLTMASFNDVEISRPLSLCVHSNVPLSPAGQLVHDAAIAAVSALVAEGAWPIAN